MEPLIATVILYSGLIAPLLAIWGIACLYTQRSGEQCRTTHLIYFATLLVISGLMLRTVAADDSLWLVHASSLGAMIVCGTMRRPGESSDEFGPVLSATESNFEY